MIHDDYLCLHVVVALEEVGDLALAELGVSQLAGGGRAAQNEVSTLFRAVRGPLVGEDQLLQSVVITLLFYLRRGSVKSLHI